MISAKHLDKRHRLSAVILTLIISVGVSLGYYGGLFTLADNFIADMFVKWRGFQPSSGQIVLVLMDERSAVELNRRKDDWSRHQLARALANLHQAGAEIIGVDLVLTAPDADPSADQALAQAIEKSNNVVLARVASSRDGEITPLPVFQEAMIGDGFIDLPLDKDQVLRSMRFFNAKPLPDGNLQLLPAFALELARTFLNIDFTFDFSQKDSFLMGDPDGPNLRLPYPELLINFHGDYTAFPHISFADVVKNRFAAAMVRGKLVIIGSSLAVSKDFFTTPFSRLQSLPAAESDQFDKVIQTVLGPKELGVACHAFAVETILNGSFIKHTAQYGPGWIVLTVFMGGGLGLLFYHPRIKSTWDLCIFAGSAVIVLSGAYGAFLNYHWRIDIAPLLFILMLQFIAGLALQKIFNKKREALVTDIFGRYVSPGIVHELLKNDMGPSLEGRRQEVTVLFSDLRNFTSLSENLGAKETGRLLNHYFEAMIEVVFRHNGTLDKLIGDALMAFFGAPVPDSNHPVQAAETALNMIQAIEQLKQTSELPGIQGLEVGIGLNTGSVIIGNLGSPAFMDYTVIGDTVNLASRLEGLNKVYGTRIIIGPDTANALDDRFLARELDYVRVKGQKHTVTIYELVGCRADASDECLARVRQFKTGLEAYRNYRWQAARRCFEKILEQTPSDGPSRFFVDKIDHFGQTPPPKEWRGVTVFDQK